MYAIFVGAVAWNGVALLLGIAGAIRRDSRRKFAKLANLQAAIAAGLSVGALVFGAVARFAALLIAGGSGSGAVPNAFILFGASFWALGGIFPFTIAVFLLAERRGAPETKSD